MIYQVQTARVAETALSKQLNSWLEERQQLLRLFWLSAQNKAAELAPSTIVWCKELSQYRLKRFVESLVDYLSYGHLCVYENLIRQIEQQDGQLPLDLQLGACVAAIGMNTDHLLEFDALYQEKGHDLLTLEQYSGQLSALGEHLADLFELEDILLHRSKCSNL